MPRVLYDFEHGARGTEGSTRFYDQHKDEFSRFVEAWVFNPFGSDDPALLGFFHESQDQVTSGPRRPAMPALVLIDKNGDQLWLRSTGMSGGEGRGGALRVLRDAGFDTSDGLNRHYVDGKSVLYDDPNKPAVEGDLAVHNGRIVKLVNFDSRTHGDDAAQAAAWWSKATVSTGWLAEARMLKLYGYSRISEKFGHFGYHLIARGKSGREAWLQFPDYPDPVEWQKWEKDIHPFWEWQNPVLEEIFASVGMEVSLSDNRGRFRKFMSNIKPRKDVISWGDIE
jgi:hypothetical protein